jgi:hypothetical protein
LPTVSFGAWGSAAGGGGAERAALDDAGINATLTRVDIEPALNAAPSRSAKFDVVIHDAATPGIPRDLLEARLRAYRAIARRAGDGGLAAVPSQLK